MEKTKLSETPLTPSTSFDSFSSSGGWYRSKSFVSKKRRAYINDGYKDGNDSNQGMIGKCCFYGVCKYEISYWGHCYQKILSGVYKTTTL